ncbi:MAG: fatty acid desaturase [Solirubrobacteraceae bacterium]|nr:fatty acid desaturase [Solirubrobacteraceae bacterium]
MEDGPGPSDIQPVENETLDRTITGLVTLIPFLALFLAAWVAWNSWLHWSDLITFAILYSISGFGITVGFHRLFTHRSFKTGPRTRRFWAIAGSTAIEGPVISWVADHRKHHAFSDQFGDPHSPHVDHGHGWKGAIRGLVHAHVGWIFMHDQRGSHERYAPDLLSDPVVKKVNDQFIFWATGGILAGAVLGFLIGGFSWQAALTGLLWGGIIRLFLLHHVTFSINSLCHFFGRQPYETGDHSRNFAPLALLSFGESWHNNHHAFPTSAAHGLQGWQIDPSQMLIGAMEKTGLAWDVIRVPQEKRVRKEKAPGAKPGPAPAPEPERAAEPVGAGSDR